MASFEMWVRAIKALGEQAQRDLEIAAAQHKINLDGRMTTRRQSHPTVEVPAVPTQQMLCTLKSYRDESWATELAKTQELPAMSDDQAESRP